jgi:hypothetical protein
VSWRKITCQERDALKGARELAPFASRTDKGEFYPCRRDIFEATYEAIDA